MLNQSFFLCSDTAKKLYSCVRNLPIIDYHNHLSVRDIADEKKYTDITDLWISSDPYKHRAMRMCGVDERYITGSAPGYEKFFKWCDIFPRLIGNPLSNWSAMELEYIFGINEVPNRSNAGKLFCQCNQFLEENDVSAESLMERFKVEYSSPCVSITDDPALFEKSRICAPSVRGDDILGLSASFIQKLSSLTGIEIKNLSSFQSALTKRLEIFSRSCCRFSDHALDNGFRIYDDDGNNENRFKALLDGILPPSEKEKLSSFILIFLASEYSRLGFVMQLHLGAQRLTSSRLRKISGPTGGYASIGNSADIISLIRLLDGIDKSVYGLPKTVIFPASPTDYEVISSLSGSFSRDGISGLITLGPAWWWNDNEKGIIRVLEATAAYGLLDNFIGMTTDSRSLLSFVRHDYFRRIFCRWTGEKIDGGSFICSMDEACELAYRVCYGNAAEIINHKG